MGVVYKGHHAMLRRPTAIKMLDVDKVNEGSIERFEREVQITSQLNHPNTVAIYDYGRTPEGVFYYAMEYLDGIDLQTLVERYGPQPVPRVIHILLQVCGSLYEAHSLGLVHRDIKPANIMLNRRGGEPDVVKVLDFGLVKAVDDQKQAGLTQQASLTGTPLYMSPEAIQLPNSVDARSDLYAVGAVGYFLLTGHPVFEADNPDGHGNIFRASLSPSQAALPPRFPPKPGNPLPRPPREDKRAFPPPTPQEVVLLRGFPAPGIGPAKRRGFRGAPTKGPKAPPPRPPLHPPTTINRRQPTINQSFPLIRRPAPFKKRQPKRA